MTKTALLALLIAGSVTLAGSASMAEMVKYKVENDGIKASLTGKAGDVKNGRKVAINRKKGNCLACHASKHIKDQLFHGEIGPELDGASERYSEAELRLRLVNAQMVNEDTMMPAFYKNTGLTRVRKKFIGKTILTAQEIEDVLAFLKTLK